MGLFSVIDFLFAGTQYLVWGIAVAGVPASLVLLLANLPLGLFSAAIFVATLLLAAGCAVVFMPKEVADHVPAARRLFMPAIALVVVAAVLGAAVYFLNGGLPEVSLLFA